VETEESPYLEPVSPTPLPDSPVDEVRGHTQDQADKKLLSPQLSGDDGFTETKGRKVMETNPPINNPPGNLLPLRTWVCIFRSLY
jgi:hypothetical protein